MVGRVVVGRLGGRIGRLLVVDRVVGRGGCRLPLLVRVSCRAIRGSPGEAWLARCSRSRVVVVVINDNDLFGQAVLVEVGPVGVVPPPFGRPRCLHAHAGRSSGGYGGQLLWLARVCGCGSAEI